MKRSAPMKRTPMKRSAPLRTSGAARLTVKVAKPKCKAPGCGQRFVQTSPWQILCPGSVDCATSWAEAEKVKREAAALKKARRAAIDDRRRTRAQLEALKTLKELRAEAQQAFNAYIRARDRKAKYGCICCGAPLDWDSGKPGGSVDAGHFVSRGSAIELAFDERNVNAQRKSCNRPGGTTRASFTAGMVQRYGAAVVAELEGPHDLPHLKHDDLRAIREKYRAKANALKTSAP